MRAKGKREVHQKEAPSWKDKVGWQKDTEDGLKRSRGRRNDSVKKLFNPAYIMFHPSQTPVPIEHVS